MFIQALVLASVLAMGPCVQLALPSTGSPRFRVPHFRRYYGSLRFLVIHPAALRIPSLGGTTARRLAMQVGSNASLPARISTGPRTVSFRGDVKASQVPGESLCACPCSRDPGEARCTKTLRCTGVAFRNQHAVGPRGYFMFSGLCDRGLHTRCLRFAARVAPVPRKTRFRLVTLPWPDGLCPRGTPVEVSDTHRSLPPSLAWRKLVHESGKP